MTKIIILFGVSGCGKSTIGTALSKKTGIPFFDADDFHPAENISKMKSGAPLTDEDRLPWLKALNKKLLQEAKKDGAILACSALKESYRVILNKDLTTTPTWGLLNGSFDFILQRINSREGHFMPTSLLQSQFDTLEIPDYALVLDVQQSVEAIVEEICENRLDG